MVSRQFPADAQRVKCLPGGIGIRLQSRQLRPTAVGTLIADQIFQGLFQDFLVASSPSQSQQPKRSTFIVTWAGLLQPIPGFRNASLKVLALCRWPIKLKGTQTKGSSREWAVLDRCSM